MPKPKIRVSSKKAVELIKSGADDTVLMETFGLSGRGLRKLFRKLLDAGEIQQPELERRLISSTQSHAVELGRIPVEEPRKAVVRADEAVSDISSGMSDVDLMKKYRLSLIGLEVLFEKLVAAGALTAEQLRQREGTLQGDDTDLPESAIPDYAFPEDDLWRHGRTRSGFAGFLYDHQVLVAAFAGAVAGMLILVAGFLIVVGFDRSLLRTRQPAESTVAANAATDNTDKQVQEAMTILKAIASDRNDPTKADGIETGAAYLEECLNNCKKSHDGRSEPENVHLSNCRRECLSTHSELFRKMRQKYYGLPE